MTVPQGDLHRDVMMGTAGIAGTAAGEWVASFISGLNKSEMTGHTRQAIWWWTRLMEGGHETYKQTVLPNPFLHKKGGTA